MSKRINLTGQRFGMLVATGISGKTPDGKLRWKCVCDCGRESTVAASDLKKPKGGTKSCGCQIGKSHTHGMTKHPAYAVWRSMLARCFNPDHYAYHNYGGRGIIVCPRWRSRFENFWEDMGPTYAKGLSLDRTDNEGGYSPENCRWVDSRTQSLNRRDSRFVVFQGERMNVSEAARRSGVKNNTLLYRLAHGWPEDSLFIGADFSNRPAK